MGRRRLPPCVALRAFEAAARHGNFRRAAEDICVSPSAISHQVRALEDNLGVQLFFRDGGKPRLTSAGEQYYHDIEKIFDRLSAATRRVKSVGRQTTLSVQLFPSLVSCWMLRRLPTFQSQHPGVDIRIVSSLEQANFGIGDVDVAIAYGSADWPGLHCDFLHEEEVYLICSPELADELPALKDPDALRDQTMIHCSIEPDEWSMWFYHTGQRKPQHCRHLEFNSRAMVLDAVADSMGVALGRTPFVLDYLDDGKVIAPYSFKFKTGFGYSLVYPEPNARYEGVAHFRTWLLREFGHEV